MSSAARVRATPLAAWRKQLLLSQRDLAAQAGVAASAIALIETGRTRPHLATIRRLCEALGVEPDQVTEFRRAIQDQP